MKRLGVIIVALVAGSVVFASGAAAYEPTTAPFSYAYNTVMTGYCSFPVDVLVEASGTRTDFVDENGVVTRSIVHQYEQDTFSANGKTLISIPSWMTVQVTYDSNGNLQFLGTGIIEKIVLPDGSLFVSAGLADFFAHTELGHQLSPDYGSPGDVAAFCAALSP
jgi:hypothetical protein